MIHSMIKKGKESKVPCLLVEVPYNIQEGPSLIKNFYDACKDENIKVIKSKHLTSNMLNFFTVSEQPNGSLTQKGEKTFTKEKQTEKNIIFSSITGALKSQVTGLNAKFTIIYINQEDYQFTPTQKKLAQNSRVILLRQTLDFNFFDLNFQVQNTLSQQQSMLYLCNLAAMIINCQAQNSLQILDQKKDRMIRRGAEGAMSEIQVIWRNIVYQTPGIGKSKCKIITQNFPTYQSLLKDCQINRKLQNLSVERGTKQIKIGSAVAQRIYKIFGTLNGDEELF